MDENIEYLIHEAIRDHISGYAQSHGGEIIYKRFEDGIVYGAGTIGFANILAKLFC